MLFAITQPIELSISEITSARPAAVRPGMNPPRGDAEARRGEILDAALRVFGQYGFRRTSMDDIAREAGIAKGTIYLSFAGKEEVFQALSEASGPAQARWLPRPPDNGPERSADTLAGDAHCLVRRVRRDDPPVPACGRTARRQAPAVGRRWSPTAPAATSDSSGDVLTEAAGELQLKTSGLTADTAAELLIAAARGLTLAHPRPQPTGVTSTRWSGS